jgi:carboxymethylenebutenolidase
MGEMIELSAGGKQFPGYVARPDGEVKGALIVIHEVWGLVNQIKGLADRFAAEGYVALAPEFLGEMGITEKLAGELQSELFDPKRRNQAQPKLRELMAPIHAPGFGEATLAGVQECFSYLENQEGVNGRIGVIGFCFGGSYSFSLAVHQPKLKAAIPFYGHADFSVEELKHISCPILAFYGQNDERLMTQLPELKTKMQQAAVDFRSLVYPDCGHAFFNETNPFAYNKAAADDAWEKTLRFIEREF